MLKKRIASLPFCLFCLQCIYAEVNPHLPGFIKTKNSLIIYPDANLSGYILLVKLQVITEKIINVIGERASLATIYASTNKKRTVIEKGGKLILKTPFPGSVSFTNKIASNEINNISP